MVQAGAFDRKDIVSILRLVVGEYECTLGVRVVMNVQNRPSCNDEVAQSLHGTSTNLTPLQPQRCLVQMLHKKGTRVRIRLLVIVQRDTSSCPVAIRTEVVATPMRAQVSHIILPMALNV